MFNYFYCSLTQFESKTFVYLEEAVKYLFSAEVDADILALPPEVDELTGEEMVNDVTWVLPKLRKLLELRRLMFHLIKMTIYF